MSTTIEAIREAESFSLPQGHDALMSIMTEEGDLKHTWSRASADEVAAVRQVFDDFTKNKGYTAYLVKKDGEPGEVMRIFDPAAELMILRPRLIGG